MNDNIITKNSSKSIIEKEKENLLILINECDKNELSKIEWLNQCLEFLNNLLKKE